MMFLSKLKLDLEKSGAYALDIDPEYQHKVVMSGFGDSPGRVLFRLESSSFRLRAGSTAAMLVQSEDAPDWSRSRLADCCAFDVKEFDFNFSKGQRYIFRLRANPTVKKRLPGKQNGARVGIENENDQIKWLQKKGLRNGFLLIKEAIWDEGLIRSSKYAAGRELIFKSVRFEGVLEVENPERFERAVVKGIGSAKAFGFGLLSLAKV